MPEIQHGTVTMYRPSWADFFRKVTPGYVSCQCGYILQTVDQIHDHWLRGHFDYSVADMTEEEDANR